ncbi:ATP phosphoribosyltransferase regulatory subunit [uncultured Adlercreutzia sp.]|uniref:ATP phosphoribosyltransferase regulatory subunit n=1 Tax=uncultured Adlercreutzia sp. TaxID=875803 RepID=UPI0025EAF79A|nr:ATP phosphoribosyltransferase regulatory subunit [uncultured Adlercreutzia sp.]MCI9262674.1 ATP phosphoribosyltransferase regulatory subunit [Eggerthellaceae bacterium]
MNVTTPAGFRDVLADEAQVREAITRAVADLFASRGYQPIETPTLEVMDVMRAGGRMPASPFKFFDSHDDLLAMRPDVTLQIARMCATRLSGEPGPLRFRYTQRVFREAETDNQVMARELTQCGVECIGEVGPQADSEIIELFAEALTLAGVREFLLGLATVGVLRALLERSGAAEPWAAAVLDAYHDSDFVALDRLCALDTPGDADGPEPGAAAPAYVAAIRQLAHIRGGQEAIDEVRALVAPLGCTADLDDFEETYRLLAEAGLADRVLIDFSLVSSFNYYTGIVFEAYAPSLGSPLGSGGRYDRMIGAYGADRPAAGFAFYLEQAMSAAAAAEAPAGERPLRIAVPKGSLNPDAIACLAQAGLDTTGLANPGRALVISNPGVDYIIVRPSDAPVFVALGAADCGICGKDSLLEVGADVVELVDLRFGECRFVVAESAGTTAAIEDRYRKLGSIRVATKYPSITRAHFAKTGTQVDIVYLHGNIELAPITGMAERIVDITATGTTLRENNLDIVEEVLASTARFFANGCSLRTDGRIVALARALAAHAKENTYAPIAGASNPSQPS